MNSRAIWGISLAAIFAVSMILSQSSMADPPAYLVIEDTEVVKDKNTLNVRIDTAGTIPEDGSGGAFGYGMFTGTIKNAMPENVLALTTHECASDHLFQLADGDCAGGTIGLLTALGIATNEDHDGPEWHSHILDLMPPSTACAGFDAEVDLARTLQTKNNVIALYPTVVDDDEITAFGVPLGDLKTAKVQGFGSFTISPVASGTTITNLCLDVVGTGTGL